MRLDRSMVAVLVAAGTLTAAATALAQPTTVVGGYLSGSFPMGDWSEVAGAGLGFESATIVYPDSSRPFAIRSGSSLIYSFKRNADVPAANLDANTELHTETTNTSLWIGIGPEFSKPTGDTRPFIYGTVGANLNWMNSHLKGDVVGNKYDANVGHSSVAFAWTAGGGIRKTIPNIPGGMVELSVEYRSAINHTYVIPGEVTSSGANVRWDRTSHNADQIIVRIGTVL